MKRLLLAGAMLLFSHTLYADGVDELWDRYSSAKLKYQDDLAVFFVETHPELKDLITTNHDLQVTMIQLRKKQYYYLLGSNPSRIVRDQGISKWSNFNWSDSDQRSLSQKDPRYVALSKMKDELNKKNQGHPDWPAYRKAFSAEAENQRYQEITKAFMDATAEIEKALKKGR